MDSADEHYNPQDASEEEPERNSFKRLGLIIAAVALLLIIALLIVVIVKAPGGKADKLKDCSDGTIDIEDGKLRYQIVNNEKMDPACQIGGQPHNGES